MWICVRSFLWKRSQMMFKTVNTSVCSPQMGWTQHTSVSPSKEAMFLDGMSCRKYKDVWVHFQISTWDTYITLKSTNLISKGSYVASITTLDVFILIWIRTHTPFMVICTLNKAVTSPHKHVKTPLFVFHHIPEYSYFWPGSNWRWKKVW